MSELEYARSNPTVDASPDSEELEELLDASSLHTVLTMLEVIDSLEELALLETLTPAQKRQVWDATPEPTRMRLKQLRAGAAQPNEAPLQRPNREPIEASTSLSLIDSSELEEDWFDSSDETSDLDALAEIDLTAHEPLNLSAQSTVAVGNWIVLQAQPNLSRAELMAIWEVVEVRGNYARIRAESLGARTYPTAWMAIYPQPIEPEPEF
ncbi:hypothetical protein HJG54_08220 [Leptolyngbya sp. NK1-12]|uniref:Uncharacterized protein n=1 Tax=Leptolyngbya sp. NK1-12 TaxID=2547451 RepID=A0AA96WD21_9CYAN|nr:hypothetical protein [Leptolyngbya sp. NK1-12]WNZ22843.1 hypothetical protein HJG54_08220 [Leptolyngbya sp. NK1-12]